jgi:deazaflavin-dependent oxidoreductase (nitroreductase family)
MVEKNSNEETIQLNQAQIDWIQNRNTDLFRSFAGKRFSTEEWNALNQPHIEQFRANQGTFDEGMFKGEPILLLTTTGARSGKTRVHPLSYTRDGDRYVVLASKLGAPEHPSWYYNLIANPIVTVEVGAECFQVRASVVEGNERKRLFDAHVVYMPNFADYQSETTRVIPVVVLERIS